MRLAAVALVAILVLAGCDGAASPDTPSRPPASQAADPSIAGYSDADQERIVRETIAELFCSEPASAWCRYIGDPPDVVADGMSLFIGVARSMPTALAEELCRDLAFARFDENAEPVGYINVHVQAGPEDFRADCDAPN